MPAVKEIELPAEAQMGVAVEGSAATWPGAAGEPVLPSFDVFDQPRRYIDVFNKGQAPFEFSAATSAPWIALSASHGTVEKEQRIWVSIDWRKAAEVAKGRGSDGWVKITRGTNEVTARVRVVYPQSPTRANLDGFVEADGYVSIEAEHYAKKSAAGPAGWEKIEDLGRTLSAMTIFPVTAASATPPNAPCLEYRMYLFDPGKVEVEAILSPTQNFVPGRGLRYAISFDEQAPQTVDAIAQNSLRDWETTVKDAVRKSKSTHTVQGEGYHTLKFWMVDPAVVLQKLVVDLGGVKPSYLGPPESYRSGLR
jgi:hypothetical protein